MLENRLYVKAEKCDFPVPSVSFLGYIIGQGQIRMDPSRGQYTGVVTRRVLILSNRYTVHVGGNCMVKM